MPNPFLPRSPGGGTSTDRSASNPLNLIKPPFFAKNSAIVFEPLFSSQHQISITFVASSISSSYSFLEFHLCTCLKNHSLIGHGTLLQTFALFRSFFLANTNHLILAKIYQFWFKRISVFREKISFPLRCYRRLVIVLFNSNHFLLQICSRH